MPFVEQFAIIIFLVQVAHSLEELLTDFHKRWYLFKMTLWEFVGFEFAHNLFWATVLLIKDFPYRDFLLAFFILLMFANGVQHVIWWGVSKRYVPGLITAYIHITIFLVFYYLVLFK